MRKLYSACKDFAQGTYLTTHERILKDNDGLTPEQYDKEADFRNNVNYIGGLVEIFSPLALSLAGLPLVLDGFSRVLSGSGLISLVREQFGAKHRPSFDYNWKNKKC